MTTTRAGRSPLTATTQAARRATTSIGVAVALGAVSMTFAALFLAYAVVRAQAAAWPPPGEGPRPGPLPWALLATVIVLGGSGAVAAAGRTSSASRQRAALLAASASGAAFIAVQAAGWMRLAAAGLRPSSGLMASVTYALTIFHALHAGAAVALLAPLVLRAARGRSISADALSSRASFFHFVTAAWLVIFFAVFVL